MPGDGFGEEWQFREILEILDDPDRCPVLVHCARGTCRTGAAVALYRFERDGWTIDDVAVEMRRQTYRYGWLPGYMYAMAKNRPALCWTEAGQWWKTATEWWKRQSRRRRMYPDRAFVSVANRLENQSLRLDHAAQTSPSDPRAKPWTWVAVIGMALGFVASALKALDLGLRKHGLDGGR